MFPPRKIFPPIGFCLLIPGLAWSAGKVCTTSSSRQFLVYGAEVRVRGTICALAERTKSDLLRLLGLRDGWKTPLIINLDNPQANIPGRPLWQLDVSQLGYGLKLQLNLLVIRETNNAALQRELLRAILVEMMYRDRGDVAAGTLYVAPPDWLVEGILALQPGRDSDKQGELFRIIVASKRISPLEDIVRQRRDLLDAPSRQLYEAYARALVQLLLDTPDGRSKAGEIYCPSAGRAQGRGGRFACSFSGDA